MLWGWLEPSCILVALVGELLARGQVTLVLGVLPVQ